MVVTMVDVNVERAGEAVTVSGSVAVTNTVDGSHDLVLDDQAVELVVLGSTAATSTVSSGAELVVVAAVGAPIQHEPVMVDVITVVDEVHAHSSSRATRAPGTACTACAAKATRAVARVNFILSRVCRQTAKRLVSVGECVFNTTESVV